MDARVHCPNRFLLPRDLALLRKGPRLALTTPDIELPPGYRFAVQAKDVENLLAHILCNTLTHTLELSHLPLYCRRVGMIDAEGCFPSFLEKLIRFAPEVLLYTQNETLYSGWADKILDEYGAPITMVKSIAALSGCSLVLCLSRTSLPSLYPVPVFSLHEDRLGENLILSQPDFSMPEVEAVLPAGISSYEFYTAAYTLCGIQEIRELSAQTIFCRNNRVSCMQIADQIRQNQAASLIVR